MRYLLNLLLILGISSPSLASDLHMARSPATFPETMLKLQSTIKEHGYTVSRVQRVDIGLTKSGYKTDKYRVVFYGKADEISRLSKKYPFLIPYLPLQIAIFAEGEETLLISPNPTILSNKSSPELDKVLNKWEEDLSKIMHQMRVASD